MSTHTIPFSIYKGKSPLIIPNMLLWIFFYETQERVRNSRGKRAISVKATEVLLYLGSLIKQASSISYRLQSAIFITCKTSNTKTYSQTSTHVFTYLQSFKGLRQ